MKNVLIFLAGTAVGSVITFFVCKGACEKKVQEERAANMEEVNKVIQVYQKATFNAEKLKEEKEEPEKETGSHEEVVQKINYGSFADRDTFNQPEKTEEKNDKPYVIHPKDFAMDDDYSSVEYTFYEDGYLVNEIGEVVMDHSTIGDALQHIGEYEPDCVYVRNPQLKIEYAIYASPDNYEDYVETLPPSKRWR